MCTWPAASRGLKSDFKSENFDMDQPISIQQNRRRKKRPSYGVRTVEIERGRCGYGFTISGQEPCILSCIVNNSPAERAGLRPGDYLIAVNSQNVSKAPHDDVVRLIGTSSAVLKLQIAENYYSDSSDDDELVTVLRSKPKYPNRTRHRQNQQRHVHRAEKVLQDLHTGLLFQPESNIETTPKYHDYKNITDAQLLSSRVEKPRVPQTAFNSGGSVSNNYTNKSTKTNFKMSDFTELGNYQKIEEELKTFLYPSLRQIQGSGSKNKDDRASFSLYIYRAVVGYLGTIEMPKELQLPGNRLQVIRNCIRRLRVEKKVHTLVLLTVYKEKVTLVNSRGFTIAEYPAEKITYNGIYANDKKFFGLVTSHVNDENLNQPMSSSCHVFMIDSRMVTHQSHAQRAKMFNIKCGGEFNTKCAEFPDSADPILDAVSSLNRNWNIDIEPMPHSNTNTSSSNSDSGIGFRDEFHLNNDRVFVVEVGDESNFFKSPRETALEKLRQSSASVPPLQSRSREMSNIENRLTVRAMPDPVLGLPIKTTPCFERSSFHKYLPSKSTSAFPKNGHMQSRPQAQEEFPIDKLSPKVYGIAYPSKLTGSDIAAGTVLNNPLFGMNRHSPDVTNESTTANEGSEDVHPPSQEDDDSEYAQMDDVRLEISKRWTRTSSLQRQFSKSQHVSSESGALSDGELISGKLSNGSSMLALDSNCASSEIGSQDGRVASWAVSFEKLLDDPAGVHTFAAFLKKEFSHENINFWIACERYHNFALNDELKTIKAKEIFERHMCVGATEPVNVDSQARQIAQEGLEKPNKNMFLQAQRQIYNLMKFDCYARFLKSPIYKNCIVKEMADEPLPYPGDDNLDPHLPYNNDGVSKGKKSKDDNEEKRRKSLLSWNRTKSYKKSNNITSTRGQETRKSGWKKRKDKNIGNENVSEMSGSHSSLTSGDLRVMQRQASSKESLPDIGNSNEERAFCRVLLPDHSTTVVETKTGQSVMSVIQHLLARRGMFYTTMDVFASEQLIDFCDDASILGCHEVRVEERLLFRVIFPNKKSVVVKSSCNGSVADHLRSLVIRYGFKMESVVVTYGNDRLIDITASVRLLDKQNIIIQSKEKYSEWGSEAIIRRCARSVDDTWIRVIDDIIEGKIQPQWDEFNVWDLDRNSSKVEERNTLERRSVGGILGLGRRNSMHFEREATKKLRNKLSVGNRASVHEPMNHRIVQVNDKNFPQLQKKQNDSEEMYKVWERAQRSRLDDQSGTEINFELPDFLKPPVDNTTKHSRASEPVHAAHHSNVDDSLSCFVGDCIIPTNQQAEEFFGSKSARLSCDDNFTFRQDLLLNLVVPPSSQPNTMKSQQARCVPPPPLPTDTNSSSKMDTDNVLSPQQIPPLPADAGDTSLHVEEANFSPPPAIARNISVPTPPDTPPPLPPKPKYLPPRRNQVEYFRSQPKSDPKNENSINNANNKIGISCNDANRELINQRGRSRKAMYIERDRNEKLNISFV